MIGNVIVLILKLVLQLKVKVLFPVKLLLACLQNLVIDLLKTYGTFQLLCVTAHVNTYIVLCSILVSDFLMC